MGKRRYCRLYRERGVGVWISFCRVIWKVRVDLELCPDMDRAAGYQYMTNMARSDIPCYRQQRAC